jgi:hypothetical protein
VIAPSAVDAVRYAGGWLFDRVMAGWDVTVCTADHADARPLRILGARAVDLESALASPLRTAKPKALAIDARLYGSDPRVRRRVHEVLDGGVSEVRIWGDECPADFGGVSDSVQHRLSVAARAFKAHALAAAAAPTDSIDGTELFHSGQLPSPPLPDLEPAA